MSMKCSSCNVVGITQNEVHEANYIIGDGWDTLCKKCAIRLNKESLSHDNIFCYMEDNDYGHLQKLVWDLTVRRKVLECNTVWMLHYTCDNFDHVIENLERLQRGHPPQINEKFKLKPWPYTEGYLDSLDYQNLINSYDEEE